MPKHPIELIDQATELCDRLRVLGLLLEAVGKGPERPVESKLVGGAGRLLTKEVEKLRQTVKALQTRM